MKIFSFITFVFLWFALTGAEFDAGNISSSLVIASLCSLLNNKLKLKNKLDHLNGINHINIKIIIYIPWLIKEIIMSAIAVSKIALSFNLRLKPALEAIKTEQKNDLGLSLYANSITLTPGTVTINTAEGALLVHAIDYSVLDDLKAGKMDKKILSIIT